MPLGNPDWIQNILGAATAVIGGLVGVVYTTTHKRIDSVEEDVEKKADHAHVKETTAKIDKLHDTLASHIAEENGQFARLYDALHANHIEVIKELNKKADK